MTKNRIPENRDPSNSFAHWQPLYAAHGIATFPVQNKHPAIRGYMRVGLRGSEQLAFKFPDAAALGFMCGARTKISVGDVDTIDERVLANFLEGHGATPIIVRTASGKFHCWYRHAGERRCIRPWGQGRPFDILGGGFVVAPPSQAASGRYQFLQGSLDDLGRLPVMRGLEQSFYTKPPTESAKRHTTRRNCDLWDDCMRAAKHCAMFENLLDEAREINGAILNPLDDAEVVKVAASAWRYEESGQNRFGQHGAFFATKEAVQLIQHDQDAFVLLGFLRASNQPGDTFPVANGLAEMFGWTRKRLAAARSRIIAGEYITRTRKAFTGHPALYRWLPRPRQGGSRGEV
jgi:hypothetical protein